MPSPLKPGELIHISVLFHREEPIIAVTRCVTRVTPVPPCVTPVFIPANIHVIRERQKVEKKRRN